RAPVGQGNLPDRRHGLGPGARQTPRARGGVRRASRQAGSRGDPRPAPREHRRLAGRPFRAHGWVAAPAATRWPAFDLGAVRRLETSVRAPGEAHKNVRTSHPAGALAPFGSTETAVIMGPRAGAVLYLTAKARPSYEGCEAYSRR